MKTSRTPTEVSLKARSRGSVGLNMEHAQYELSRMLAEISGDARNIKSTEYMHYYLVQLCEVYIWCYCVKARDHCCVFVT